MPSPSQALTLPGMVGIKTERPSVPESSGAAAEDRQLLGRMAAGEDAALGLLYDRYSGSLYGVAYRIVGERVDAEEVVLEAFSQAWREAAGFRSERGSVIAWLTMICRSRAIDLVRARGRRARLVDSATAADPDRTPGMGGETPDPSAALSISERARQVNEALAVLSVPQRQAIQLAYYEGLSHSEIAERLQEPLGTVKTRVRLAMQKLKEALRPYYFEAAS